jgi:hypothetical protein
MNNQCHNISTCRSIMESRIPPSSKINRMRRSSFRNESEGGVGWELSFGVDTRGENLQK